MKTSILELNTHTQSFEQCYEAYRQRLNQFASERGVEDKINAYLVAVIEGNQNFNHAPHLSHMALDAVALPFAGKLNLDLGHHGVDYFFDYQNFSDNVKLERMRKDVSSALVDTIQLLGTPSNYVESLALSKLLYSINPNYLTSHHMESFKNIRSKIDIQLRNYSHQRISQQLDKIEADNKFLLLRQNTIMDSMQTLVALQDNVDSKLVDLKRSNLHQVEFQSLKQLMQAHGIETNEKLDLLLLQDDYSRQSLHQILVHLEEVREDKLRHYQLQKEAANYQGLMDGCAFIAQVGQFTGSRDVVTIARVAQAGIQIFQSTSQILSGAVLGVALLGPYAAIGMAAISVFSLFRRSTDPNQQIIKQLAQLSRQIQRLHRDVLEKNAEIDQRLCYLLEQIHLGFDSVHLSINVSVIRRLDSIQDDIKTLTRITKVSFEQLFLKELSDAVSYIDDLYEGISPIELVTQRDFEATLRTLRRYILQISCSPLLNGSVYSHLLEQKTGDATQLIQLLECNDNLVQKNLLGLIILFGKQLTRPTFMDLDENVLFHPEVWRIALSSYLKMLNMFSSRFQYDAKCKILLSFEAQAAHALSFFAQIRQCKPYYEQLFSSIMINADTLDKSLKSILNINEPPSAQINPTLKGALAPEKISRDTKCLETTKRFFKQEIFFAMLKDEGIIVPDAFILAHNMGIGKLEYTVHLPSSLYKKHHKHTNKFRVRPGDLSGIEIQFNMPGHNCVLFTPGITKRCKKSKLPDMYKYLVFSLTNKAKDFSESVEFIEKKIKEHSLAKCKQRTLLLAGTLSKSQAYYQLLKTSLFLVTSIKCAGFYPHLVTRLQSLLMTTDVIPHLEDFARSSSPDADMPKITMIDLDQLRVIQKEIFSAMHERQFHLTVDSQIVAGIAELREALILQNTWLSVDNSCLASNNSRSFFSQKGHQSSTTMPTISAALEY